MCGIFGYLGDKNTGKLILNGLKKLEYRGYDSWGIALKNNSEISCLKKVGKISDVSDMLFEKANLGIGHTRWATHGNVTMENAHPHFSCKKDIVVVHNGIIENYAVLKKLLDEEGHVFVSKTDSEVIAHLVEKFYKGNLEQALRLALQKVEGTYGLVVFHINEDKLVAARNGSPLVLGIGKNEFFVASDVSPIIEHTKNVVYLDDKELLIVNKENYTIKNLKNVLITKKIEKLNWKLEQIQKNNFKHFMLKEIFEQPESIKNTFRGRIKHEKAISKFDSLSDDFIKDISRIIITACGTSWHAALIGEYLIEDSSRLPVEVEYASEFRYRNPVLGKNDLVIIISQSGETADTLAALREAKKRGAKTLGIVNVVGSTIAREAGRGIYLHAGPEIGVASTKAFTSQITALYLLNLFLGRKNNNISMKKGKELIKSLEKLPEQIQKILKNNDIKNIAKKYHKKNNFLYLGRGINFPVALEGALKLKEISYIHAEGYPAAEMKHGPIALIDENMPVVFIANKGVGYEKIKSNMEEVKARKGKIIAIATEKDKDIIKLTNDVIFVPKTINELTPLLNTVPLQLLAYYIADLRGKDPDYPRSLAKSVTVE